MIRRSYWISFSAALILCLLAIPLPTVAQTQTPASGVFIKPAPSQEKPYPYTGSLQFERSRLDFAPQSLGVENCANIPLNNTTDRPRLLTKLVSLDPKHFSISSPSEAMMPLTLGGNSSLYINVCFKTEKVEAYSSELIAIFQTDTVRLILSGKGVTAPVVRPNPKEAAVTVTPVRHKRDNWNVGLAMPVNGILRLTLEDDLGKVVRNFTFTDSKVAGEYQVGFDGKGDDGKRLAKGVYFFRMEIVDLASKSKLHASTTFKMK